MTDSEPKAQQSRMSVDTVPDAETSAVIVAAVRAVRRSKQSVDVDGGGDQLSSLWARAGRREAMTGRGRDQAPRDS